MFYQVNNFEWVGDEVINTPCMITTDVDKAMTKANECLTNGMNTEIVTWTSETELNNVECIYANETDTSFVKDENGIVISRCVDR